MKRIIIGTVCLCWLILGVNTSSFALSKVGTAGMKFLKIGMGARATGMADSYTAIADDINSVFWNPAGLYNITNTAVTVSYLKWIADIDLYAGAFAFGLGDFGTLGFSVTLLQTDAIRETTVDQLQKYPFLPDGNVNLGYTGNTVDYVDWAFGIIYARQVTDKFAFGVKANIAHEGVGTTLAAEGRSVTTVLGDIGVQYLTGFKGMRFGGVIQNFGPDVKYYQKEFSMPMVFKIGLSMDIISEIGLFNSFGSDHKLTLVMDALHPNDFAEKINIGAEYTLMNMIALRGGYKFNTDEESFALGAGFVGNFATSKMFLDVSYGNFGTYFDAPVRFTIGAEF